jgi:hypothetical protein
VELDDLDTHMPTASGQPAASAEDNNEREDGYTMEIKTRVFGDMRSQERDAFLTHQEVTCCESRPTADLTLALKVVR